MLCCSVPTAEVLGLTAELQQLGGGNVAVGSAWAGAVLGTAAAAAAAVEQLDAAPSDWAGLTEVLDAELQPWLQRGFGAAVMLLGGSASSVAAIAAAACAGALGAAGSVGMSWQLLYGGGVRDPWGQRLQLPGASTDRRPGAAARPTSRLAARDGAWAGGEEAAAPCTLLACTTAELIQLLDAAQGQLEAAGGAAAEAPAGEPPPPPALVLRLTLAAADGRPAAVLHLLHLPALQGAAAEQQQEALLRLLHEAADLHQRRREGDHLLATAKLSPLNQLAAPLVAGNARLFVAADLRGGSGGSPGSSGSGGSDSGSQQGMLSLLAAVRHMQAACSKGRSALQPARDGAAASLDSWLPAQQFLEQLEQRRLAEQHRKAEVATLAAAEADRRAQLHQAAKERQQAGQAAAAKQQQRQQQQPDQRPHKRPAAGPVQQAAAGYRSALCGSAAEPAPSAAARRTQPARPPAAEEAGKHAEGQEAAAPHVAPEAGPPSRPAEASEPALGSPTDSLRELRQRFQSLYTLALGEEGASPPAQPAASRPPAPAAAPAPRQPAKPFAADHHAIAAGVAAADDIAAHVAALRMQAAAEARRALQAEQQLLGPSPPSGSGATSAESAGFTCAGRARGQRGSSEDGSAGDASGPRSGGGVAQQLQEELLLLQHQAAQVAAQAAGSATGDPCFSPQAISCSDFSAADLASLGDLEGQTPSLAALHGQPASRGGGLLGGPRLARSSSADEGCDWRAEAAGAEEQEGLWKHSPGAGDTPYSWPAAHAVSPLLFPSTSVVAATQSDVFQSANLPLWLPGPVRSREGQEPAARSGGLEQPPGPGMTSGSWHDDHSGAAGASAPSARPQSASSSRQRQQEVGGPVGSYAAAWRRQASSARPSAAASQASQACSSRQLPGQQPERPLQPAAPNSKLGTAPSARPTSSEGQPSEASRSELAPAEVAGLLEELQREQRISSALLQQLHEVQRQLEEAAAMAAAAAAAQQPPAPGVQDPDDFNGMLAALQLERRQCAALRQQLELQTQQAEEAQLALEARLHTQQRQLLVAAARCRAWEQATPVAALFRRYEDDLRRLAAQRGQLEEESCQLARLLAAADLDRLAATAQGLPEEPAAVCREHRRKLAQAQAQVRMLHEERAALSKQVQGAERRDRLAELCRRQAESGAKASAELRQQLAARERQLEAQSLAAAAASGEAERLRRQLGERDRELGRTLADRTELEDTVDSLRKQVAVLRGQLSRDRVLRSMQA